MSGVGGVGANCYVLWHMSLSKPIFSLVFFFCFFYIFSVYDNPSHQCQGRIEGLQVSKRGTTSFQRLTVTE